MHITAAGVPFHRVSGANESSPASHEANTPLLHFNKRRPPVSLSLSVTFSLVVVLLSLFPLFPPLPPPSSSSSLPLPPPSPLSLPSLLSFLIPLCSCVLPLPPALSLLSPLPRWPVSLLRRGSISFPPPSLALALPLPLALSLSPSLFPAGPARSGGDGGPLRALALQGAGFDGNCLTSADMSM